MGTSGDNLPVSNEYLQRLFDDYRRAAKAGEDLMSAAAAENRDLSPEEDEQVDKAHADVEALSKRIEAIRGFNELAKAGDELRLSAQPIIEAARKDGNPTTEADLFKRGFDAFRQGGSFAFDSVMTERAFRAGVLETRALAGNVGTAFNSSFADFVAVYERTATPMLDPNIVTLLPRSSGEPLIIPRVTADPSHGGTVTAEAAGVNELDMTLSQVTITPYKYGITNLWSSELDLDNTIDLRDLMAQTTGRELGLDIGDHLTTGDGSAKPKGFIAAATNGGTATGTGTTFGTYFGGTDLIDLYYSLAGPYRRVGSWQANSSTLAQIRKSRDTTGQLLWQPSYVLGQPESILGRPVYENPGMANGSAAKAVAFGDFKRYIVLKVNPTRVAFSQDYKFSTDQLALRTIERVGGDLPDVIAIKYLVNAAV